MKAHPLPSICSCQPVKKPLYRFPDRRDEAYLLPASQRRMQHISQVIGASPAIVFEPHGPMASTRRALPARKVNRGWERLQAMRNGVADHIHGYDDGEAEPQTRGVHPV